MGRIWRALKLGMKSLLLHKLRSGLTVLGIVFGVAAVISMLAIAEGTSREAREQIRALGATNIIVRSVKPSDEAQATGGAARPGSSTTASNTATSTGWSRPSRRSARSCRSARSASRSAAATYTFDGRVVGTTQDYADFNLLQMEQGPVPDRIRQRKDTRISPFWRTRPPRSSSPTRTRWASRSSSAATITRSSA